MPTWFKWLLIIWFIGGVISTAKDELKRFRKMKEYDMMDAIEAYHNVLFRMCEDEIGDPMIPGYLPYKDRREVVDEYKRIKYTHAGPVARAILDYLR